MTRPRQNTRKFLPSPHAPSAPLDWRFRRAEFLAGSPRPRYRPADDDWVRAAAQFLRSLGRCRDAEARCQLARRWPELDQATALHTAGPPGLRLAVQARLLAAQPVGTIAARTGLTSDAIRAYERLCYAVNDAREAADYLADQAIGPRRHRALFNNDVEALIMVLALACGPQAIDSIVTYFLVRSSEPKDPGQLHPAVLGTLALLIREEAARLARTLPGPDPAPLRLLALADALAPLDGRAEDGVPCGVPPDVWAELDALLSAPRGGVAPQAGVEEGEVTGDIDRCPVPEALLRRAGVRVAQRDAVTA